MTITKETAYKLYDLDKKIVECTRQLGTLLEKREETISAALNSSDPEILEMYADTFLD